MMECKLANLPTAVSGFGNYSPQQQILIDRWKRTLSKIYRLHGFNPLEVPPFVRKEFLRAKGGIIHQIFAVTKLNDDQKTAFGLAFDRTVPLALWVRDHQNELHMPYKRYDISLSYRGEKTSMGRFNGFYQCDVDIIGRGLSLDNDVQCISALVDGLRNLLKDLAFTFVINDIKIPKALFVQAKVPERLMSEAMHLVDKMEKAGVDQTCSDLQELLKGSIDSSVLVPLVKILSYKGPLDQFPVPENFPKDARDGLKKLKTIIGGLDGINVLFSPGLVRGLDYYTGVVFETFLDKLTKAGSIMSGGRYDKLVDVFSRKPTGIEGVGGSIGLSRLLDVLLKEKLITPHQKTACKVIILTRGNIPTAPWTIAKALRAEGIACDLYTGNSKSIKKQLNYTDKNAIPIAVMIMDKNTYCVKKLFPIDKKQQSEDFHDITDVIRQVKLFILANLIQA